MNQIKVLLAKTVATAAVLFLLFATCFIADRIGKLIDLL
jgi:hypothetical protein